MPPFSIHSTGVLRRAALQAMPAEFQPPSTNNPSVRNGWPMMKLLSGVNASGPLTNLTTSSRVVLSIDATDRRTVPRSQASRGRATLKAKSLGTRSPICHVLVRFLNAPNFIPPSSKERKYKTASGSRVQGQSRVTPSIGRVIR